MGYHFKPWWVSRGLPKRQPHEYYFSITDRERFPEFREIMEQRGYPRDLSGGGLDGTPWIYTSRRKIDRKTLRMLGEITVTLTPCEAQ